MFTRVDSIPSFTATYSDPELQAYFSKVAEQAKTGKAGYSAFSGPHLEWQLRILSDAFTRCLLRWTRPDAAILDIGCGHGMLLEGVAQKYRLVGIDFVLEMLNMARKRGYTVYHGDAMELPFSDSQFDAVVCAEVCNQVSDVRPLIAEAVRVCAPGGIIAISTLNWDSLLRKGVGALMDILKPRREMPTFTARRRASEVLAAAAGLPIQLQEVAWILSPTKLVHFTRRLNSALSPYATNFILCLRKTPG